MAIAAVLLGASPFPASAVPPDEAVLSLEKYSTPKGRSLGTAYHAQLRQFSEQIYHCVPWVDIRKHGLGFNKPRFATADDRYLSVWLEIDQHEDAHCRARPGAPPVGDVLPLRGRDAAAAGGPAGLPDGAHPRGLRGHPDLPKPGTNGKPGVQPVNETLALFVDRASLLDFGQEATPPELAARAKFTLFDGQQEVGRLPLEVWRTFMTTFKLPDYQPPSGRPVDLVASPRPPPAPGRTPRSSLPTQPPLSNPDSRDASIGAGHEDGRRQQRIAPDADARKWRGFDSPGFASMKCGCTE